MDRNAYVELHFSPSLELIPVVRRFVASLYERLLSDPDAASRIALATHELLENTVKFATDGASWVHLEANGLEEATQITLRISNRSTTRDREIVVGLVREMQSAADPFEFYQTVMRKNARRTDGSGLGLARICAEAEMTLDCELDGDRLTVVAQATVPGEPRIVRSTMPAFSGPRFTAASSYDGRALQLRFAGNADLDAKDALEVLMPRVHAESLRLGAREVVVDFTALEFMSSSCFRALVSWISDVQDLPTDRQYRIRLISSASVLWQRRSLHALKCFADDLVELTARDSG